MPLPQSTERSAAPSVMIALVALVASTHDFS
jgi:hypothetical protein